MANFSNPADVCAIYLAELEQLEKKLRDLRKRVSKARRAAKTSHVHWAHVGAVKHLNSVLAEQIEFWQPRYDEPKLSRARLIPQGGAKLIPHLFSVGSVV